MNFKTAATVVKAVRSMSNRASLQVKRKTNAKGAQEDKESKEVTENQGLKTLERVLAQHEEQKVQLNQLKKKAAERMGERVNHHETGNLGSPLNR